MTWARRYHQSVSKQPAVACSVSSMQWPYCINQHNQILPGTPDASACVSFGLLINDNIKL